jgi:hypothetical protein
MVASAAWAGMDDPAAEVRYRMKYGRSSFAEEVRSVRAESGQDVTRASCHTGHGAAARAFQAAGQEARFTAEHRHATPEAEEARKGAAQPESEAHGMKCAGTGQCPQMHASTPAAAAALSVSTDTELRLHAKYGLNRANEPRQPSNQKEEPRLLASADLGNCEHACCKHAQ